MPAARDRPGVMLKRINAPKDFLAGLIFLAVGTTLFLASHQYRMGTATSMGPGYYPRLLGIVLCLFGLAAVIKGALSKTVDPLPNHKLLPLVFVFLSVISFSLLIDRAGFVVASLVCLLFACFQRLRTKPLEVLAIFVGLTVFNYIVFIYFFEMTIPVFWWE